MSMPARPPETETGDASEAEPPDLLFATTDRLPWPAAGERRRWAATPPGDALHRRLLATIPAFGAIEARLPPAPPPPPPAAARILFWNVERLRHGAAIAARIADLAPAASLLAEVDLGMARSGNRHTVAELAGSLGQGYLFGVEFLELGLGDARERTRHAGETDLAGLHGNAILSPHPLARLAMLRLEAGGGWFDGGRGERRIGARMALLAQLEIAGRPVTLVCTHLESHTDAEDRRRQMARLLDGVEAYDPRAPVLIGGDFNTAGGAPGEATPGEPLFALAAARGYDWHACNRAGEPTRRPPAGEPRPDEGRLDWFFSRGLRCRDPRTLPAVGADGRPLSDHEGILVTVTPG